MKPLYHPNALPVHLREKLPNPSRPIEEPVIPATARLFDDKFDPIYQDLAEYFTQQSLQVKSQFPKLATVENVLAFLKHQQSAETALNLADFIKNVRPLGQTLIETVVKNHPNFYPNLAENRLFITTQFWQNLLALFLIAQCKTRKTLNHDLTLQRLSQQMNGYLAQHARHIGFLTHDDNLQISSENVAFAILALDGNISKPKKSTTGTIGERVTNVSSHNFLSKFTLPYP